MPQIRKQKLDDKVTGRMDCKQLQNRKNRCSFFVTRMRDRIL